MKTHEKNQLILEYAALASKQALENQPATTRMEEIEATLHMTAQAIIREATTLALASMK